MPRATLAAPSQPLSIPNEAQSLAALAALCRAALAAYLTTLEQDEAALQRDDEAEDTTAVTADVSAVAGPTSCIGEGAAPAMLQDAEAARATAAVAASSSQRLSANARNALLLLQGEKRVAAFWLRAAGAVRALLQMPVSKGPERSGRETRSFMHEPRNAVAGGLWLVQ
jgi:hypothetical protein